ncbi:putative cell wall-associated hydrolase [Vibrio parahaemolyticus 10290]|nr:putative cell wall-associated hydrolase [Vibrio parahaemolyticus 10290]
MLSAVIDSELSYRAMRLATQPEHQRFVHSGPLVLGAAPFNLPTPTADRTELSHDVLNPARVPL